MRSYKIAVSWASERSIREKDKIEITTDPIGYLEALADKEMAKLVIGFMQPEVDIDVTVYDDYIE